MALAATEESMSKNPVSTENFEAAKGSNLARS